jgi:hypothetical protein
MIRRSDVTVSDALGTPEPGVYITVKNDVGDLATLYDDSSNLMANPFQSGVGGAFAYNIADGDAGTYTEEYRLSLASSPRTIRTVLLDTSVGTGNIGYATRSAMAAVNGASAANAILRESGREGLFVFSSTNLSTFVTADTQQGIYVAPSSDTTGASGAWVRKFSGPIDPKWFGVLSTNSASANASAWNAMAATLLARAVITNTYRSVEAIRFTDDGIYNFGSNTIELLNATYLIEGVGAPSDVSGTCLQFSGATGIRIHSANTTGTTTRTPGQGSDRTIIRNLRLKGGYTGTEGEFHGVQLRVRAMLQNLVISDFEGDGVYIAATAGGGGAIEGNANCWRIDSLRSIRNRDGISIGDNFATADTNAGISSHCDLSANRRWGIADRSFLGNTHVEAHTATNGIPSAGSPPAYVSSVGNRYGVISGQEIGASTNAPSGTTADNTWWYYIGAGGATSIYPAWVSGTTYRAGGPYFTNNTNAKNLFINPYAESDQGFPQLTYPTMVTHGAIPRIVGLGARLTNSAANLVTNRTIGSQPDNSTTTSLVGEGTGTTTLLQWTDSSVAPLTFRWKFSGNDILLDYSNGAGNRPLYITGPNTTNQFGTGAAVPYAFYPVKLMIGDFAASIGNARRITMETAAPSSNAHAQGEIVFNRTPAQSGASSNAGWKCRTAGTPGTWDKFGGCAAAPTVTYSLTYAAPAGGTTVDTEGRASLAQLAADVAKLAADNADLRTKLQTAGLTL